MNDDSKGNSQGYKHGYFLFAQFIAAGGNNDLIIGFQDLVQSIVFPADQIFRNGTVSLFFQFHKINPAIPVHGQCAIQCYNSLVTCAPYEQAFHRFAGIPAFPFTTFPFTAFHFTIFYFIIFHFNITHFPILHSFFSLSISLFHHRHCLTYVPQFFTPSIQIVNQISLFRGKSHPLIHTKCLF